MQRQTHDAPHRSFGSQAAGMMVGVLAFLGGAFGRERSHSVRTGGWVQHSRCSSATQRRVRKEQKLARRMQRQHDPYFRAARA